MIVQLFEQLGSTMLGLALQALLLLGDNFQLGEMAHNTLLNCRATCPLLSNVAFGPRPIPIEISGEHAGFSG